MLAFRDDEQSEREDQTSDMPMVKNALLEGGNDYKYGNKVLGVESKLVRHVVQSRWHRG